MAYRLGVDIGGTFTDFALFDGSNARLAVHKRLTTPADPSLAVISGLEVLMREQDLAVSELTELVHGTTLVTNAIIERRGANTGMLVTQGFADVLDMRQEKRYDVFDWRITFPAPIVPRLARREVRERIRYDGEVLTPVDLDGAVAAVKDLLAQQHIESLAIAFLHAYANPVHELAVREHLAKRFAHLPITTSAEVFGGRREFERFTTAGLNAFTQPMFERYVGNLQERLRDLGFTGRFFIMSSSGGTLTPETAARLPVRVVESGPAAGVRMSVFHGRELALPDLLSFDMGGTTAKGALIRGGDATVVYEMEVARSHEFKAGSGLPLHTPVIDMIEIGAGGGSIASVDARGTIQVGPRSAGAEPGPACYGRGGDQPTLTDANVVLGYLDPNYFLGGEMALDQQAAQRVIEAVIAKPLDISLERAALGIHDILSEDVARAFRIHASERGFDYRRCSMVAFGGSGPVHALSVARKLRIPRVVFPVAAGVMSALGLLASPLSFEVSQTYECFVDELEADAFTARFNALTRQASKPLLEAGLVAADIHLSYRLDMRYHGQGHEIEVVLHGCDAKALTSLPQIFEAHYKALYSGASLEAPAVITHWKVAARGPLPGLRAGYAVSGHEAPAIMEPDRQRPVWFAHVGRVPTPIYNRYGLRAGDRLIGPALIEERESTIVVGPGEQVHVDGLLNIIAELGGREATA